MATEARLIRSDSRLGMMADFALDDVTRPDVVMVPGGIDVRPVMKDERVLTWLRAVHATTTWTTSVCSGSLILGAAGICGAGGPPPTGARSTACAISGPRP